MSQTVIERKESYPGGEQDFNIGTVRMCILACNMNTAGGFNPHSADHSFRSLAKSLGYEPGDHGPVTTLISRWGIDEWMGTDSMTTPKHTLYDPTRAEHTSGDHVAGITALIADAPDLDVSTKAILVADLIAEFGEGFQDQHGGWHRATMRKRKAILEARNELKARKDLYEQDNGHTKYHDILSEVDRLILYKARVVTKAIALGMGTIVTGRLFRKLSER